MKKKIIYLSGFTGGKRDIFLAKKILKDYNLIYFKYNTFLTQSVEEIGKELKHFIKDLKLNKKEKIHLIGLSAGGIIAIYYAKFLDKEKSIDKVITIHSPINGTYFAGLFPKKFKGLRQMKSNSDFIKRLSKNKTKINQINFWNYIDLLVPGKSGKGESPMRTYVPHLPIAYWPPIYYKINKFLKND
jgi:triacylglycerol esterase/lipase EstA (alpha/beta hydrolase family)